MLARISLTAVVLLLSSVSALAGENPTAKLAMHLVASSEYLDCADLMPAACDSIDVDLSVAEVLAAGGYGCIALLAYDIEGITAVEFVIDGWPTGRGAPALNGPYWCIEGANTFGDHLGDGGATSLGSCVEPSENGMVLLGYLSFGPLEEDDLPITLSFVPSTYTEPEDSLLGVTDCTEDFVIDEVVLTSGCTVGGVHGTGPDCGGRQEGGGEGTGGLLIEEIWSMGEGTLPEGVSLPVRAIWSPTPGQIRLLRPNGEIERDVQLPFPGGGGSLSYLSEDGSIAILRSGVAVRGAGSLSTRVVDLREEGILYEGESSGNEAFWPSPGGEMVLHNDTARSSALRRADLSLIKSTNSVVVKWGFSRQYLATLEVDLLGEDSRRSNLRWPPIKGPLYLRVYDFQGNIVLDEFLDEISAGIDIDVADEGTVAALYRKFDVARWTPPRTYSSSDFILVLADLHNAEIERRGFTVPRDTRDLHLALSPNGRFLVLSVLWLDTLSLYELDAVLGIPDTLSEALWTCSLPEVFLGRLQVEIRGSLAVFEVSNHGLVVNEVLCQEGDKRYVRILVSDGQETWWPIPTPDLELGRMRYCRFFGLEDYLLVGSGGWFLKCFRIGQR